MGRVSRVVADQHHQELVEAAARLFRERDMGAVSVPDVMQEIGPGQSAAASALATLGSTRAAHATAPAATTALRTLRTPMVIRHSLPRWYEVSTVQPAPGPAEGVGCREAR
jgi:hypothetical protein